MVLANCTLIKSACTLILGSSLMIIMHMPIQCTAAYCTKCKDIVLFLSDSKQENGAIKLEPG